MKRSLVLGVLAALVLAGEARAATSVPPAPPARAALSAVNGFVQAVPPGVNVASAYLTLRNSTGRPLKLVRVSSPVARRVLFMREAKVGGAAGMAMTGMQAVAALSLPPRGQVALRPGEMHLMLEDLTRTPREGERLKFTFTLASGGSVTLSLPVRRFP